MAQKICRYCFPFFFLGTLLFPETGHAAKVQAEISGGYDDNPAQTEDANGAVFAGYLLSLDQHFYYSPLATALDLSLSGAYQDYYGQGDNYRGNFCADLAHYLMGGRILPSLSIDAGCYRDHLLPEDERDEFGLIAGINFLMSVRNELELKAGVRWLDYRNESFSFRGEYAAEQPGRYGMQSGHTHRYNKNDGKGVYRPARRDERLETMAIEWTMFTGFGINPWLTAGYARLHSSVEVEAYRQYCLGAGIEFVRGSAWHLGLGLDWYRTEYDKAPIDMDRIDHTASFEASVSRFIDSLEVFLQFKYEKNDSEMDMESYTQTVTQCGIAWYF